MVSAMASRTLISKLIIPGLAVPRSLSRAAIRPSGSPLLRLRRPLAAFRFPFTPGVADGLRCFSTRPTTSSLNDPQPNWTNRPPKETILLDGCDFEHWLVVMEPPDSSLTRDDIIDSFIKTLAQVVGRSGVLSDFLFFVLFLTLKCLFDALAVPCDCTNFLRIFSWILEIFFIKDGSFMILVD